MKMVTVMVVMEREEVEGEVGEEKAVETTLMMREERGLTTSLAPAGGKEMRMMVKVQDPMLTCKSLFVCN